MEKVFHSYLRSTSLSYLELYSLAGSNALTDRCISQLYIYLQLQAGHRQCDGPVSSTCALKYSLCTIL